MGHSNSENGHLTCEGGTGEDADNLRAYWGQGAQRASENFVDRLVVHDVDSLEADWLVQGFRRYLQVHIQKT